jgi:hypothetical protein
VPGSGHPGDRGADQPVTIDGVVGAAQHLTFAAALPAVSAHIQAMTRARRDRPRNLAAGTAVRGLVAGAGAGRLFTGPDRGQAEG